MTSFLPRHEVNSSFRRPRLLFSVVAVLRQRRTSGCFPVLRTPAGYLLFYFPFVISSIALSCDSASFNLLCPVVIRRKLKSDVHINEYRSKIMVQKIRRRVHYKLSYIFICEMVIFFSRNNLRLLIRIINDLKILAQMNN